MVMTRTDVVALLDEELESLQPKGMTYLSCHIDHTVGHCSTNTVVLRYNALVERQVVEPQELYNRRQNPCLLFRNLQTSLTLLA